MIYHISAPDILFVNNAIIMFESIRQSENKCIIIANNNYHNRKLSIDSKYIEYIGPVCNEVEAIINSNECTGVVIHSLNKEILNLALSIRKNIPIFWRSWGSELHDLIYNKFNPYYGITKKYIIKTKVKYNINPFIYTRLSKIFQIITGKYFEAYNYKKNKIEFLRRVNLISTTTEYEYNMLKQCIKGISANFIRYSYLPLGYDDIIKTVNFSNGNNIMIGHSSFPLHNHLEIFNIIKDFNFGNSRIVCPLSYGDELYKQIIIQNGRSLFKNLFEPITEFIPYEEYQQLISSCGSFILNSKVQQAGGNIISFLRMGGKVYLPEENPYYIEFKKIGITLFSIERDLTESHLINRSMLDDEKVNNEMIINNIYNEKSENIVINQVYELFKINANTYANKN